VGFLQGFWSSLSIDDMLSLRGLADATIQSGRTQAFGLTEAMALSYLRDSRFILLTFILVGLGAWW
jgi:hypothetical protein